MSLQNKSAKRRERGFVLISVVMAITLLAIVAFMLNYQGASDSNFTRGELERDQLRYIAEAGLAHAEMQLAANTSCAGYTDIAETDFAGRSYSVSFVSSNDSPVTVESTALPGSGAGLTLRSDALRAYQAPTEITLQFSETNGKDTILDIFYPIRNYGGAGYLKVESGSWIQRPVFHIDVSEIPASAKIRSARLELKQNNVNSPGQVFVHRMTREWAEGTRNGGGIADGATWETYDGTNVWTTTGGDFDSTVYGSGYVTSSVVRPSFDVTALVQDWVSGAVPNYGMMLVGDDNVKNASFVSRETNNPPDAPKLIVTYACECGTTCGAGNNDGKLLLVVEDSGNPSSQDSDRVTLIESWGYTVALIDDGDSQATFDAAVTANDVAYVSSTVSDVALGTKLLDASIGVVNELAAHVDDFGFGEAGGNLTYKSRTEINVIDNTQFITSPFPNGLLTIVSSSQMLMLTTGVMAPDIMSLAEVSNVGPNWGDSLSAIETGGQLFGGGNANGRRVQLPWGDASFAISSLNADGLTIMQRAIEWAMDATTAAPMGNVLLVAVDPMSLTAQEDAKKSLIESWGYTVSLIDESASQSEFDTAIAANDIAYVAEDIATGQLGTKLRGASIGVVIEEEKITDEFGISSGEVTFTEAAIDVTDNTHYITQPFSLGAVTFSSSAQPVGGRAGTLAPGLSILAERPSSSTSMLDVIEAAGALFDTGTAAGRRIKLPWGGNDFDINSLTADGLTIMRRAIEWGAGAGTTVVLGPISHWKLDDGTGLTAVDSEGGHDGTLTNGPVWVAGTIGDALNFDGSNDYVDLTSDAELDDLFVGGATVMAWIEPAGWGNNGYGRIFDKSSSPSSTGNGWALRVSVDNGGIINFGQGFTGGRGWWKIPNGSISLGAWQHVAVAYDASSTANDPVIYLDGNPVAVTRVDTPSGAIASDAAINLHLGNHASSAATFFDGKIDDARIYDRMLSAAEIAEIAVGGGGDGAAYIELYQPWSASSADTWQTVDLSSYGVPASAVVEVAVTNSNTGKEYWGGVRAVGSSLERRFQLHEAEGDGVDAVVMHVQADASSQIQHYSDVTANVTFTLLGYWIGAVYVERFDAFTAGANASWQTHNLGTYGVGPNQVAEIAMSQTSTSVEWLVGTRQVGSGLARRVSLHEAESGGIDITSMQVVADSSSNIEVFAEADSIIEFHVLGYWSTPPGTYTEAGGVHGEVSTLLTWEPNDLSAFGVPPNSVAQFVISNESDGADVEIGVRQIGSSLNRRLNLQEAEGGGSDNYSMHVNVNVNSNVEWYAQFGAGLRFFYPVGWWVLN